MSDITFHNRKQGGVLISLFYLIQKSEAAPLTLAMPLQSPYSTLSGTGMSPNLRITCITEYRRLQTTRISTPGPKLKMAKRKDKDRRLYANYVYE